MNNGKRRDGKQSDEPSSGEKRRDGRGTRLLVIGGAEDPDEDNLCILPHFVQQVGGKKARILVCAAATAEPKETLSAYRRVFEKIGVAELMEMPLRRREEAREEQWLEALERATGVFLTGGDQLRITSIMAGSPFGDRLKERVREGLYLAGTSAGAAAISGTMISRGSGGTVRRSDVQMAPGLAYWRDTVVDTHFDRSGRVHRLLAVLAQNPATLGVGLDEDTAVDVVPGDRFTVIGRGTAIVFNGPVIHSNASEVDEEDPIALLDITAHVLPAGYGYDLNEHRPLQPEELEKTAAEK